MFLRSFHRMRDMCVPEKWRHHHSIRSMLQKSMKTSSFSDPVITLHLMGHQSIHRAISSRRFNSATSTERGQIQPFRQDFSLLSSSGMKRDLRKVLGCLESFRTRCFWEYNCLEVKAGSIFQQINRILLRPNNTCNPLCFYTYCHTYTQKTLSD